jgi:hypothetical protein
MRSSNFWYSPQGAINFLDCAFNLEIGFSDLIILLSDTVVVLTSADSCFLFLQDVSKRDSKKNPKKILGIIMNLTIQK